MCGTVYIFHVKTRSTNTQYCGGNTVVYLKTTELRKTDRPPQIETNYADKKIKVKCKLLVGVYTVLLDARQFIQTRMRATDQAQVIQVLAFFFMHNTAFLITLLFAKNERVFILTFLKSCNRQFVFIYIILNA